MRRKSDKEGGKIMPKVGDKYIIEIDEVIQIRKKESFGFLYRVKGFNSLVFDSAGIGKLEKLDDNFLDDLENTAYNRGLNDAWKAVKQVIDFSLYELSQRFGRALNGMFWSDELKYIFSNNTPIETLEKLRTYEAEKKAEEEIKVGDEVETDYTGNVIIAGKPKDGWYVTIAKNFARYSIHESHIIKKTGRHFPQVAELLDAMEEGGNTNA